MAYVQIRDVPDAIRDVLAARARENGQSLNMYLRDVVIREAAFVNNRDLIEEVASRRRPTGVTATDVLDALDAARERTDA